MSVRGPRAPRGPFYRRVPEVSQLLGDIRLPCPSRVECLRVIGGRLYIYSSIDGRVYEAVPRPVARRVARKVKP